MAISNTLKRRFVKDYSLPVSLVDDPYFDYFIDLYDDLFQSKAKYKTFVNFVSKCGGQDDFFNETDQLMKAILKHVTSKESYKTLCDLKVNVPNTKIQQKKLYIRNNVGQKFISLDLKKSNFQCMKAVAPDLVDHKSTYEEFLTQFTSEKYIMESKYIRQLLFGNLNPKRQMAKQKEIIAHMILSLQEHGVEESSFLSYSADEIVLINDDKLDLDKIVAAVESSEYIYHVEEFELSLVHPEYSFFLKTMKDKSVVFKNTPSTNFAEIYKFHYGIAIDEDFDLAYITDGRIAHFDKPFLYKV